MLLAKDVAPIETNFIDVLEHTLGTKAEKPAYQIGHSVRRYLIRGCLIGDQPGLRLAPKAVVSWQRHKNPQSGLNCGGIISLL